MGFQRLVKGKQLRLGLMIVAAILLGGMILTPASGPVRAGETRWPAPEEQGPARPEPVVLHADRTGVGLEWSAPEFSQARVVGDDGRSYVALDAPGWTLSDEPGQPRLPQTSALVVVPPSGEVTLHTQVLAAQRVSLAAPVLPARRLVPAGSSSAEIERVWARDERFYAGDTPALGALHRPAASCTDDPSSWVALQEAGRLRGFRLMRVTFSPLCFQPARLTYGGVEGAALEAASRVRVELRFPEPPAAPVPLGGDDPFVAILERTVANPGQLAAFAAPRQAHQAGSALAPASAPPSTEYLIIAHDSLLDGVVPLADRRAAVDGLAVYSTTTQAIYTAYSGGAVSAVAIRDYISATYHTVGSQLTYVLLVGDGTEDGSGTQYVPPYMIPDPWGEEPNGVAADNRYVTMDGPDDYVADLFVGRLPVSTAAQAQAVVQKIIAYETDPAQYPWNERVVIVAGHEDAGEGETFHQRSDWLHGTLPSTIDGRRIYFCTQDCGASYKYTDIDVANERVVGAFNAGALLVTFEGHSSWYQWDWDPVSYAPLFHVTDHAGDLSNGAALPVVLPATCYTSRFAFTHPTLPTETLDEVLLRQVGGGAVATWGNTTLGKDSGQKTLRERFFYDLFERGTTELGPLTAYSKIDLGDNNLSLHDTFVLLGDPAMDFNLTVVPWADQLYLPLAMRNS